MPEDLPPHRDMNCYCYCVVGAEVPLELAGLSAIVGGEAPRAVRIGGLQAIVSAVPAADYGEDSLRANFRRADWVEVAVLGHERVVEGCLEQTEVVPMKFCTLFRSEDDLIAAVGRREDELVARLRGLEGKQEWGIRLAADRRRLRQHLLESDSSLRELAGGAASKSEGAAYFSRRRLEEKVARCMEESVAVAAVDTYARLSAVATEAAPLKPPNPAREGGEPVLNAAFLVTAEQREDLLARARQIVLEMPWLDCTPTGPWPPYNFV